MTTGPQPLLQLKDISFAYRALPVIEHISWEWLDHQQWAFLGPNGCGKTTLAKLLCGQLAHGSGTLELSSDLQRSGLAYVCFEEQKLLCERDQHLDDSEFRADAHDPGTTVQAAILRGQPLHQELSTWARRLRIEHILQRGIRFISTGEMRKTLLLRAILSNPGLLILDSPLDGLDRASQRELSGILQQLLQSPLRILMLCRDLEDLPQGIDHILTLSEGTVVASGARESVLCNPAVQRLMYPADLTLHQLPPPAARPYSLAPSQPLLQLRNVTVNYQDVQVLNNVNWTLQQGQHCCVSGPNGCGKTTLLSLINGDNHKAYGQDITLFGIRRGSGESVWDIKQKFGLLNTELQLKHVRGMKVIEVVVSGFFDTIGLYDDWGDQQRDTASQWLAALGLADIQDLAFDTLSFGIQRMVLLARAMVKSPVILILDEPCLGLDGHHKRTILRAVDHIANSSDTHIIYVSHSAGEMPACVNQHMEFVAGERGFTLSCRS